MGQPIESSNLSLSATCYNVLMTALDMMRRESLNLREQQAFSEISDTLIFETPQHFKLSRKSIPEYSRRVQEEFLTGEIAHEQAKLDWVDTTMKKMLEDAAKFLGKKDEKPAEEIIADMPEKRRARGFIQEKDTPTEAFLKTTEAYLTGRGVDDSNPYNAWGFTPKLANGKTERDQGVWEFGKSGSNCFGVVQTLGALYNRMGLDFEMGITADHPFAIAYVEGKTYLSSLFGVHEAKGSFEMRDGHKLYIPSPEDKIPYKLMSVWNFDEGLVYEQLENFEVLRQMSLGNKVRNLPRSEESGKALAEQHHGTLQNASWRTLQKKLTPHLAAYFQNTRVQWEMELERVSMMREMHKFFDEVMEAGKSVTTMKDLPLKEFRKQFLPLAKLHGKAVADIVRERAQPGADTPPDVVAFAHAAKRVLSAIPIPELQAEVTQSFLRPFEEKELEIVNEERLTE